MKLIAGSILAGFGLLVTALLQSSEIYPPTSGWREFEVGFTFPAPIEILAIIFIAGGIGLIGWAIWEMVTKRV
jgi:hypothetical protein